MNSLGQNLLGSVVFMSEREFILPKHHPIRVTGGPGALASDPGNALFGACLCDGEPVTYRGMDVDRLLTAEELDWWERRGDL